MIEGPSGVLCQFVRQIGILRNEGKGVGVTGIVEKRVSVSVWSGCPRANFPIIFLVESIARPRGSLKNCLQLNFR
jgi:hypothetical protein